jgi:hypothetical protein
VVLDILDRDAVREAVLAARPDAIVHQATALAGLGDFSASTGASRRRTGCAPRAPMRCSPPQTRPASAASLRRATAAGRTRARAGPSRRRRTRSTPLPCRR